jgi:hypothetical protein
MNNLAKNKLKKDNKLLDLSIAHHRRMFYFTKLEQFGNEDIYSEHCPLCQEYREKDSCGRCPIAIYAGDDVCSDTPWGQLRYARVTLSRFPNWGGFREAEQEEIFFLIEVKDSLNDKNS